MAHYAIKMHALIQANDAAHAKQIKDTFDRMLQDPNLKMVLYAQGLSFEKVLIDDPYVVDPNWVAQAMCQGQRR